MLNLIVRDTVLHLVNASEFRRRETFTGSLYLRSAFKSWGDFVYLKSDVFWTTTINSHSSASLFVGNFFFVKQATEKELNTQTDEWQFRGIAVPAIPSDHFATLEIQSTQSVDDTKHCPIWSLPLICYWQLAVQRAARNKTDAVKHVQQ